MGTSKYTTVHLDQDNRTDQNYAPELDSKNSARKDSDDKDDLGDTCSAHSIQHLSGPLVRRLDLSQLYFSLNFYFLLFLCNFPLCFLY